MDELRKCCNMLLEAAQDAAGLGGGGSGGGGAASVAVVDPKLSAFAQALDRILRSARSGSTADYKVYICDEAVKPAAGQYNHASSGGGGTGSGSVRGSANGYQYVTAGGVPATAGGAARKKRVVNYWCFSTGVAMSELQRLGVKSLLLTSGEDSRRQISWSIDSA